MRGDTAMTLRLLTHPRAMLGGVGAVAAVTAFVSAYLPWYEVAANVVFAETTQSRPVATLPGWAAQPWGWLVPAIALATLVVAVMHAVDRPLPATRPVLLGAGLALGLLVALSGFLLPPVSRFDVAGSRLRELAGLADRLPKDVELAFSVRPGLGLWLTLAAAVAIVAASAIVKDDV